MSIRLRAALAASCAALGHALAGELPPSIPPVAEPAVATAPDPATPAPAADAATDMPVPEACDPVAATCGVVPAGSSVLLEILDPLSSASTTRGDAFRFRLAEPVRLGDAIVIPAGTEGRGEIIHAQRAGSGGKAGELLLAARHLDHAGTRIALRGMKLGGGGTNRTNAAIAVTVVTGPFGMLVRGGNLEIPAGTLAQAKLAVALAAGEAVPASRSITSPPTPSGDAPGEVPRAADVPATTTIQQEQAMRLTITRSLLCAVLLSSSALVQEAVPAGMPAATPAEAPAAAEAVAPAAQEAQETAAAEAGQANGVASPPEGKGQIVFFRDKKFTGGAISYIVREGGEELGKLSNGSYFVHVAEPGAHAYTVHSEAKDVMNLEVEAGETYYVVGSVSMGLLAGRPNLSPTDQAAFDALSGKIKPAKPLKKKG